MRRADGRAGGKAALLSAPGQPPSRRQQLNVFQHFVKSLPGRRFRVLEGHFDAAVEAERLQLEPDEAEPVVVE